MTVKIAEVNIVTILIVLFVGTIGIMSIEVHENLAIACVSGLVGYMGRYIESKYKNKNNENEITENYTEEEVA